MPCTLRCCDFDLVTEWTRTCDEYMQKVIRPFSTVPFKQLWRCEQPDWHQAFTEWSVFQFWIGLVAAAVGNIILICILPNFVAAGILNFIWYSVIAYLLSHVGWFAVVKRHGCCCLVFCCIEGELWLLVWGLWAIICALGRFIDSLAYLDGCAVCIINVILQAFYSIVVIYMGVCCVRLWMQVSKGGSRDVVGQPQVVMGSPVGPVEAKAVYVQAQPIGVAATAQQPAQGAGHADAGRKENEGAV